jgi:mono/diheme cytochrome c family protein
MVTKLLLGVLLSLALGPYSHAADLEFAIDGQPVKAIAIEVLSQKVQPQTVEVKDPVYGRLIRYEALPLKAVLQEVFGADWRQYDALGLRSQDGYTPIMPARVLEQHAAFIALKEAGQSGFPRVTLPNGETLDPGPLYVVWENIHDVSAKNDPALAWSWQLARVSLHRAASLYGRSTPAAESNANVKAGFTAFQTHCVKCHAINGEGGQVGPELNAPTSVTANRNDDWIRQFVRDPRSLNPQSKMPAWESGRDTHQIDSILAYLHYMAQHQNAP